MVPGEQRIVAVESDLLQTFQRGLEDDRIAELIEVTEIDFPRQWANSCSYNATRVGFRADKIQRELRGSATGYQEFGFSSVHRLQRAHPRTVPLNGVSG